MLRNNRIILIAIIILFAASVAVQHFAPEPTDWSENYDLTSQTPYGACVLSDLLKESFGPDLVVENSVSFFESLDTTVDEVQNLVVVSTAFFPDSIDRKTVLHQVAMGSDLLISASAIDPAFLRYLDIEVGKPAIDTSAFRPGRDVLHFTDTEFENDSGFYFNRKMPLVWISSYDTLVARPLGTNRNGQINFLMVSYGKGRVYIHTQPQAFSNYHLLYGSVGYAARVLSYLPVRRTIADRYYKPNRPVNDSPMRYILSQPPLLMAYYVLLLSLLLFFLVESKRRQRVIPFIEPLHNLSLDYVKTIGSLYFRQHNNDDLALKKTIYFREFLRERYNFSELSDDDETVAYLAAKSGVSVKLARKVTELVIYYSGARQVTDEGLLGLVKTIEQFYEQCR